MWTGDSGQKQVFNHSATELQPNGKTFSTQRGGAATKGLQPQRTQRAQRKLIVNFRIHTMKRNTEQIDVSASIASGCAVPVAIFCSGTEAEQPALIAKVAKICNCHNWSRQAVTGRKIYMGRWEFHYSNSSTKGHNTPIAKEIARAWARKLGA